jgi:hypothetical protein
MFEGDKSYPHVQLRSQQVRSENGWHQQTTAWIHFDADNAVEIPQAVIMAADFNHDAKNGYPTLSLRLLAEDVEVNVPPYVTSLRLANVREILDEPVTGQKDEELDKDL